MFFIDICICGICFNICLNIFYVRYISWVYNVYVFVIGGYDRFECFKILETFDLNSNKWILLANMGV